EGDKSKNDGEENGRAKWELGSFFSWSFGSLLCKENPPPQPSPARGEGDSRVCAQASAYKALDVVTVEVGFVFTGIVSRRNGFVLSRAAEYDWLRFFRREGRSLGSFFHEGSPTRMTAHRFPQNDHRVGRRSVFSFPAQLAAWDSEG